MQGGGRSGGRGRGSGGDRGVIYLFHSNCLLPLHGDISLKSTITEWLLAEALGQTNFRAGQVLVAPWGETSLGAKGPALVSAI